jgi:hypothetical protein
MPIWIPSQLDTLHPWYIIFDNYFSLLMVCIYIGVMFWAIRGMYHLTKASWRTKKVSAEYAVGFSLLVSLILISVIQTQKMFYEASLIIPLFIIVLLLTLKAQNAVNKNVSKYAMPLIFLALLSHVNILYKYKDYIQDSNPRAHDRVWQAQEDLGLLVMAGTGGYEATRLEVMTLAEQCGITAGVQSKHVMTDMLTYQFFQNTYQPLSLLYMAGIWYEEGDKDYKGLFDLLNTMESSGMVTLCSTTPGSIRKKMLEHGRFCCLKPGLSVNDTP